MSTTTPASTDQRDQIVQTAVREISHIATLPEVTLKIVELVENPRSTAQDLHKVISTDPALCSRILKVVNSSFYGLPGQIGSVNRAIVLLGLNAVKNIAIAASLAKLFRGGEITPTFNAKDLWTHSASVAVASKVIADNLKLGLSDEAFLAGLIHDIGVMVELQFDRAKLIDVINRTGADKQGVPANNMIEIEQNVFGATHQDFGAALCEKWRFPQTFRFTCGYHHRAGELAYEHRTLPCIVHAGERIAEGIVKGFRHDLITLDIDPEVREHLKLTGERIEEFKRLIAEPIKTAGQLLS